MKEKRVQWFLLLLTLGAIMMLGACKKKVTPPPPPPPPPPSPTANISVNPNSIHSYNIEGGTRLTKSLTTLGPKLVGCDRIIVITDEQSQDGVPGLVPNIKGYIVNVAPYKNGIGADKGWTKIDGWSERVIDYILESENLAS